MNLEILLARKQELENSASQLSNTWQTVQGHKAEIDYWISELQKPSQEPDSVPGAVPEGELPVQ